MSLLPDANPTFWQQLLLSIGAVIAVGAAACLATIHAVILLTYLSVYSNALAMAVGYLFLAAPFIALGFLWYLIWKKSSAWNEPPHFTQP